MTILTKRSPFIFFYIAPTLIRLSRTPFMLRFCFWLTLTTLAHLPKMSGTFFIVLFNHDHDAPPRACEIAA